MKAVVIFYSYEGNCKFAARQIGKFLKADIVEIQTVNKKRHRGFAKYLFGGIQVLFGKMPALEPVNFDPDAYDLIIIGTPVWAASPAPAMKTFLSKTVFNGKKTALFMCHAGGIKKAMSKFKTMLKDSAIISELEMINPARNPEDAVQKIEEWTKTLTM
jgi:flavodoxin